MSEQLISNEKNLSSTSPVKPRTEENGHENSSLHFNLFCVKKYFSPGYQVRLDCQCNIYTAGHSLSCYSITYDWHRNSDYSMMNPSINVSEPIEETKVCADDMNICVKLEGSDGIERRNI